MVAPKRYVEVRTQEPVNVTVFGKRVFADIIKLRVLIRDGDLRHREGYLRKEAEPRAMQSQPRKPGAARSWKRQGGPSPRASGGIQACPRLDLGL